MYRISVYVIVFIKGKKVNTGYTITKRASSGKKWKQNFIQFDAFTHTSTTNSNFFLFRISLALLPLVIRSIMQNGFMKRCLFIVSHMPPCQYWICSRIVATIGDSLLMLLIISVIHCTHRHRIYKYIWDWLDSWWVLITQYHNHNAEIEIESNFDYIWILITFEKKIFLHQLCELGNLSTHICLRNLRPAGTRVRKIPVPDWNPLTQLFKWVEHMSTHSIFHSMILQFISYWIICVFAVWYRVQIIPMKLAPGYSSQSWLAVRQPPSLHSPASIKWPFGLMESTATTETNSETTRKTVQQSFHSFCKRWSVFRFFSSDLLNLRITIFG